ncbi:oxidoreductase [Streptosporangium sp. 'caverna']|uniref:oxidoreductase n=1 Tax=Streptosporangium sp. 'caverna' TaxID=2202249 RepID=UPI000D7DAED6|nr:oxidoreductase [Streptosporangium sp. 'caverna']AWS43857.1 oxidoreductase [Streptosporangium sp. 'caverna']
MTTPQTPLGTGHGPATTAGEILAGVDLTGRTAIVTGGYSGLGVETVRALREAGASVVVPVRDHEKAAETLAGTEGVQLEPMDLTDPTSIDAFADGFLGTGRPLHMLVNSAGIMAAPLSRDARGYESHFATNHLGHFQLTLRLWPALLRAEGARVVAVSSSGHRRSGIVWDDVHFERRPYDPLNAYGQSKTANNLFAVELDRRGRDHGIRAFALHPGAIVTPLARHTSTEDLRRMGVIGEDGEPVIDPSRNLKTPEQGAATSVWCATARQLDGHGGVYCENSDIAPLAPEGAADARREGQRGISPFFGVMPYSIDPRSAIRLWDLSEQLTGARLDA